MSAMVPAFDIFQVDKNGAVRLRSSAETLKDAKLRVKILNAVTAADYVIVDQTGNKTVIPSTGSTPS
jgi:hypothetical protein